MAISFIPSLGFGGEARAALEFYQSVFGGEITIYTFDDFGGAPEGRLGTDVMHGGLTAPHGIVFYVGDEPGLEVGSGSTGSASLGLFGNAEGDGAAIEAWFAALAADGEVLVPLEAQNWGDTYGLVKDRFGVLWTVDYGIAEDAAE